MPAHDMTATINCAGCQHAYIATALFCPNCGRPKVREAPADPLLGKVLGERFLVQELLGQGGSGTIYRAEHVTLRRKVAIKVLHTELSRDDLAVERFRREATTVAEIDNEHIVEIHDFGRTPDGRLYLAMELLEGETLDVVLTREHQLSVERAADILIQVGEALMEAHAIGYVHRDLRPRNIYLSVRRGKANFIKLLDFGLAKLVETEGQAASTSLGMTFGDPRYMSPEQARGDRIDRRADIYQLGCVAYEMLTGAPPFGGNRVFDILTKQVTEAPQPLPSRRPGTPLWMEAAITKMLAKDPENRFATTTRMVEALRRGLETGEVMEAEVARRRESIPPVSVSRVMQKMGLTGSGEQPRVAPEASPVPAAPAAPPPASGPLPKAPVLPPVPEPSAPIAAAPQPQGAELPPSMLQGAAPPPARVRTVSIPPLDPGATMRGSGPAPLASGKPDSVELLRKRTGTPRIGVPIVPPAAQPVAPPLQPPVAGVIEPAPLPPPPAAVAQPVVVAPSAAVPVAAPPVAAAPPVTAPPVVAEAAPAAAPRAAAPVAAHARELSLDDEQVRPPVAPEDAAARGKRTSSADLNISQVWYDEGDQLADGDSVSARSGRARKSSSPSVSDMPYYDEPPRRRWGWLLGIGAFVVVGGTVAFALTRGGSPEQPAPIAAVPQPSATAPIDAAPSTIIASDPAPTPPAPAPSTPPSTAVAKSVATAPRRSPADTAPAEIRAPVEPRSSSSGSRSTQTASFPVPGSEPTRRAPPPLTLPGASQPAAPSAPGVTDGPKDPYADDGPAEAATPEKKAEFFANLGAQQLIGGDTAGAAANFHKAIELDAKNATAATGLGEIALRQGLFGDAIAHLSKAAKLSPRNAKIYTLLGEAYLNSGNNAQAAAQFKKALQLDPDNARARDGYNEASSRVPPPDEESQ